MVDSEHFLQYTLGPFMLLAGVNKLIGRYFGSHWAKDIYQKNDQYPFRYYTTGIIEAVGGPLILSSQPKVRLSGVIGLLGMFAWMEWAGIKKRIEARGNYHPLPWLLRTFAVSGEVGLLVLGWWTWDQI